MEAGSDEGRGSSSCPAMRNVLLPVPDMRGNRTGAWSSCVRVEGRCWLPLVGDMGGNCSPYNASHMWRAGRGGEGEGEGGTCTWGS